jgi:predicted DNA-binding transcriptional regulator
MVDERTLGGAILLVSIAGIVIYFLLLFGGDEELAKLTIRVSAFLVVSMMLLIIAWIGYTLATTPPPIPLEDLDVTSEE